MIFFVLSLKGNARDWFQSLAKGEISSFTDLIEAFCKKWSPKYYENGCSMFNIPSVCLKRKMKKTSCKFSFKAQLGLKQYI